LSEIQQLNGLVGRLPTTLDEQVKAPGEMDKNDFLKMMLVQLRYQDPLDPMKANEYAAQLAQFTTVEELQNLNVSQEQGLQTDILLAQSINNTLSSTLIGKVVKAVGGEVMLKDGESGNIVYDLPQPVQNLSLTIRDANGNIARVIHEDNLGSGEGSFAWDGKDNYGNALPDGSYSVEMTATDALGNSQAVPAYIVGKINAVQYTPMGAVLMINGQQINFGDVIEIREAEENDGGVLAAIGLGTE